MTPTSHSADLTTLARSVLLLVLAACDTGKPADVTARRPPTFRASCATPSLGVCTEFSDEAFALGASLAKTGCLELRGSWSPARCPSEQRLGTCTISSGTRVYYPGGDLDFTSTTAARDCVELYQGAFSAR